ncbi:MAG: NAD(P)H-binding protein [Pseudomonadota bacterium]
MTAFRSYALLLALFLAGCSEQPSSADSTSVEPESQAASSSTVDPQASSRGSEAAAVLNIVVFGASGKIGGLITQESIDRGHKVIGVSRNPEMLAFEAENFSAMSADLNDVESVKKALGDADTVIVSVTGIGEDYQPESSTTAIAARTMVEAFTGDDNAPYVIQIGGASTMFEDTETMLANFPFPAPEGSRPRGLLFGQVLALETYEASTIPWTVLTPPPVIRGYAPNAIMDLSSVGYRTATEFFVMGEDGKPSPVMAMDLAKAAVDEAENKAFVGKRFTVGI